MKSSASSIFLLLFEYPVSVRIGLSLKQNLHYVSANADVKQIREFIVLKRQRNDSAKAMDGKPRNLPAEAGLYACE